MSTPSDDPSPAVAPRVRRWHVHAPHWSTHPGMRPRSELTLGERAADKLRNGMGSWGFVFGALIFLAGWMLGNRNVGFDKYPFILLNLVLSCLAALQGAILLIAAKREDQISSELARHDYETNVEADRIVKEIHTLTVEIHRHVTGSGTGTGSGVS
ncbi:MAG: DUF1003 domain-containing protein [Acidimicrobiales bacterium]